ncbi:hypothetical protein OG271_10280 [Micromonospora rifamycinica]|uniref:hypothetical protein n=1 Tax=Micromonospora rifamycinica TaxID=291594 RepID=UPI002E2E6658|nr:hypothetical protein [Micromonospora rifamycinica]
MQVSGLVDAVGEALPQVGVERVRTLGRLAVFGPISASAVAAWAYLRAVLPFMSSRRAVVGLGTSG